jgi:tRNA(adenine34) deaminase
MLLDDNHWMRMALRQAMEAFDDGEVPIGAVAVKDNRLLGKGRNRTEALKDPTAHAEMEAITAATAALGEKQLNGVTLYVTLEPCSMCTGALVLARVERVVYGADDPKAGACGSLFRLHDDPRLNHRFLVSSGPLAEESAELLKDFFRMKRLSKKKKGNGGDAGGNGALS